MAVSVRIPTILRTYTNGESEVSASGDTLAAVLDDLDANFSGIKGRVLDEAGNLRRFVNVYVGNEDVRFLDNLHRDARRHPDLRDPRRRGWLLTQPLDAAARPSAHDAHDDCGSRPDSCPRPPVGPDCGVRR